MIVDLRDNMNNLWITHFQDMARGKIQTNNHYFLNQKGRGLGTNPKGCALYRVQTGGQSISSSLPSPAHKGYTMAVGRIKDIERKEKRKGIKRVARAGQIRKVKSHSRSKTSAKKRHFNKKNPSKSKRKKPTKRKTTTKRRAKDVFQ